MKGLLVVLFALTSTVIMKVPPSSEPVAASQFELIPPEVTPYKAVVPVTDLLLQSICTEETGGEPDPKWAVNTYGTAWGICQVKYWSAVYFGGFDEQMRRTGIPSRSPGDLFDPVVNESIAGNVLSTCKRRYSRYGNRRWAYCYYAGPRSVYNSNKIGVAYTNVVVGRLKTKQLQIAEQYRKQAWETLKERL